MDIETLQQTNRDLISTLDELNKIRADGKAKRAAAEQELGLSLIHISKSEKFILHVECKNSPQNSILFRPFRLLQTSPPQPAERARHCCLLRRIRSPPPPQTAAAAPAHTQ